MSTSRFAVKAMRGLRNFNKYTSINELPPSITTAFRRDPSKREAFESLLNRINEEGRADKLRREGVNLDQFVPSSGEATMARVVPNVHLNIPQMNKNSETSIAYLADPKLRVFEEWRRLYAKLTENVTDPKDLPEGMDINPIAMALNIVNEGEVRREESVKYHSIEAVMEDFDKRSSLVPEDFSEAQKATPTESEMSALLQRFIKSTEEMSEDERMDLAKKGQALKKSRAAEQDEEGELAFEYDVDEADVEERRRLEEEKHMADLEADIADDEYLEDVQSRMIADAWRDFSYDQKKQLYNFLLFLERSELMAKEEAKKRRVDAVEKTLNLLREKVIEMKNIKRTDYQLPEHDYEIVFLNENASSWKSRSQDEQSLFEMPITVMKRHLEDMADSLTQSATDPNYDPAAAQKQFNKFERVLNVFLSRAMGKVFEDNDVIESKPMEIPFDVLPEDMQWEKTPFHHRLNTLYEAVVERGEPMENYVKRFENLQADMTKPNQGRVLNLESKRTHPKQFKAAILRLRKSENKMFRALMNQYMAHKRAQILNMCTDKSFAGKLEGVMSKESDIQELAGKLDIQGVSMPADERLSDLKKLILSQTEYWNDVSAMLSSEYPELKPVVDTLSTFRAKLAEQRAKMAEIDAGAITDEIRAKYFPDGREIGDVALERSIDDVLEGEGLNKSDEEFKNLLYTVKSENDELRSIFRTQSNARLQLAQEYDAYLRQSLSSDKYQGFLKIVDQVIAKARANKDHAQLRPHLSDVKKFLVECGTGAFLKSVQTTEKQLTAVVNRSQLTDEAIQSRVKEFAFEREMLEIKATLEDNIEKHGLLHLLTPQVADRLIAVGRKYDKLRELPSSKKDYLKDDPNRDLKPKRVLETVTTIGQAREGMKYPGENKVKLHVKLSDINLSEKARSRFLAIVEDRYNPDSDIVTIRGDVLPDKSQNIAYAERLLTELIKEAKKADEDEAYVVETPVVEEPSPLELLETRYANVDAEQTQAEDALAVWRRIRKTGKAYVGADQTYQEGVIADSKIRSTRERHQHELGYSGVVDEDDEDAFIIPESMTLTGAKTARDQEQQRARDLREKIEQHRQESASKGKK